MTQTHGKEIMDVLSGHEPVSRKFQQNFQYNNNVINHTHHVQVEIIPENFHELEIRNHFAVVHENKILKITEIQLQNKVIKIVDTFTAIRPKIASSEQVISAQQSVKSSNRRQILNKKYAGSSQSQAECRQPKVRDTKNLVKNIIKLFQGWLEDRQQSENAVYTTLVDILKLAKFNNNLIILIAKQKGLRKSFATFCEEEGEQLINRSKVNDKKSHIEALRNYHRLCLEEEDISLEDKACPQIMQKR